MNQIHPRDKTISEIEQHKKIALSKIEALIDNYISNDKNKADKFNYWLEDYAKFLEYENKFNPKSLRKYKRGEIIKAHLGYNIGSEEGGLHYCVVIDKNNHLSSPVITVIPLTSLKPSRDISKLRNGELYIGNELYENVQNKINLLMLETQKKFSGIEQISYNKENIKELRNNINDASDSVKRLDIIDRLSKEAAKMKSGSIALVGQIKTISKIRIYDPKTNDDVLSKIKLSSGTLDKIDDEIKKLFLKN